MSDDQEPPYKVGYRNPPTATQFKKGRSGNPKGRPKRPKSFVSLLAEALDERVWINEGGRRKSISKRQALAKQFANKGAAGDIRAAKLLMDLIQVMDRECEIGARESRYASDKAARERIMARLDEMARRHAEFQQMARTSGESA
jgi:hypothetical protein